MSDTFESQQDWRYERKFLIANGDYRMLEEIVLRNKLYFSRLYSERQINNIYFDTDHFLCLAQNIDGQAQRRKLRARWYGSTFGYIESPVLEIKIREALVGCKRRYKLQPLDFSQPFDVRTLNDCIARSELPETVAETLRTIRPVLLNTYTRRYFISSDRRYRLTLDYNLTFYKFSAGRNTVFSKRNSTDVVIEIKYDDQSDDNVESITNDFPFRMTKSSKYVQGVGATMLNL